MNYLLLNLLLSLFLAKRYPLSCNGHGLEKNRRLIGGNPVPISRAPFMASLIMQFSIGGRQRERFLCGVTIIGRFWALTAASCLDKVAENLITNGNVLVRSNTTIWSTASRRYRCNHRIAQYFQHEGYDGEFNNYDNNLALLRVDPPFSGNHEKPINIVKPDYKYVPFSPVKLYGWGEVDDVTEKIHPDLQELELNLLRQQVCVAYMKADEFETPNFICVEALNDKDFCAGDVGGPVVLNGIAIGIMSWSPVCAVTWSHSYVIKLSNYYDWIFDKIRKAG